MHLHVRIRYNIRQKPKVDDVILICFTIRRRHGCAKARHWQRLRLEGSSRYLEALKTNLKLRFLDACVELGPKSASSGPPWDAYVKKASPPCLHSLQTSFSDYGLASHIAFLCFPAPATVSADTAHGLKGSLRSFSACDCLSFEAKSLGP